MEWWQWVVLGAGILAAETLIDSEFYLIFIGLSAIAVGLNGLAPYSLPLWGQWLLFATLAAGSTIIFRRKLYEKLRGNPVEVAAGVIGEKFRRYFGRSGGGLNAEGIQTCLDIPLCF